MKQTGKKANQLIQETSPYLLQHAYQPVDWYPWGEKAFQAAREENKPVFLSIGYSACHWCHVMAEESFEDEKVAAFLNQNFISVKVDREERPDIDAVYMAVCQAMTGSGGWPMSIFMTPEQKPFFAGTYFPKNGSAGMAGFTEIIGAIGEAWKTRKKDLLSSAEMILSEIRKAEREKAPEEIRDIWEKGPDLLKKGLEQLKAAYDKEYGGFGIAPKFPSGHNLLFLMESYERTGETEFLNMTERTLGQMYKGGIFDHLGGGFSRYSTDRYFLTPHFEKMLCDNGLLILCYCKAYELTGKEFYRRVAQRTANYILREMTSAKGGFYTSQDADSQGKEGRFYTFSCDELRQLLGQEDGDRFCSHYGMTQRGNFDGKNILNLLGHEEPEELEAELREKVFKYRKERYPLHMDDKILIGWNGLSIAAFAELYGSSGDKIYLRAARNCVWFILSNAGRPSELFVSFRSGEKQGKGFLDDYAYFIYGLIRLYEVTGEKEYLRKAERFTDRTIKEFFDEEKGGFYFSGKTDEKLVIRQKETVDLAIPGGNSIMAYNLMKLSGYGLQNKYEKVTEAQIGFLTGAIKEYPAGSSFFLMVLSSYLRRENLYGCRDGRCIPVTEEKIMPSGKEKNNEVCMAREL